MSSIDTKWAHLVMAAAWLGMLIWFYDNVVIAVIAVILIAWNLFLAYDAYQRELLEKANEERKATIKKVSEETSELECKSAYEIGMLALLNLYPDGIPLKSVDRMCEADRAQMKKVLDGMVDDGKLEFSDGKYRLKK